MNRYNFPTLILAGAESRFETFRLLREWGLTSPLLVTDKMLAKLPCVQEFLAKAAAQEALRMSLYDGVFGNPVVSQVTHGVLAYREHRCDSIIAMGGGAALDVAKAIALMVHHPGHLFDYEDEKPGALPVDQFIPQMIAIPTTAGTGSEVGRSAVVSDEITHAKKIIFSPRLLPNAVCLDPMLTLGLPAHVTASTGMDALTHVVESYLVETYHPLCDGIALEALRLIHTSLLACVNFARAGSVVASGQHIEARLNMLHASMMGAVAFQKGLGVTHSCAHALSTVCDMHHGLANGIMLVPCMRFNQDVARVKMEQMAKTLELTDSSHLADAFIAYLKTLREGVGVPASLREPGVLESHIPALVEVAVRDVCHQNDPKRVSADDFERLFREAL